MEGFWRKRRTNGKGEEVERREGREGIYGGMDGVRNGKRKEEDKGHRHLLTTIITLIFHSKPLLLAF